MTNAELLKIGVPYSVRPKRGRTEGWHRYIDVEIESVSTQDAPVAVRWDSGSEKGIVHYRLLHDHLWAPCASRGDRHIRIENIQGVLVEGDPFFTPFCASNLQSYQAKIDHAEFEAASESVRRMVAKHVLIDGVLHEKSFGPSISSVLHYQEDPSSFRYEHTRVDRDSYRASMLSGFDHENQEAWLRDVLGVTPDISGHRPVVLISSGYPVENLDMIAEDLAIGLLRRAAYMRVPDLDTEGLVAISEIKGMFEAQAGDRFPDLNHPQREAHLRRYRFWHDPLDHLDLRDPVLRLAAAMEIDLYPVHARLVKMACERLQASGYEEVDAFDLGV